MTAANDSRRDSVEGRLIAIGDIHGCSAALRSLLRAIDPRESDTIVCLGDFVNRGPDTCGVLETLIDLRDQCRLVPLLGNHEKMMLAARNGQGHFDAWMECGGRETLESYGAQTTLAEIPTEHFRFIDHCRLHFETATHFFVHANYDPSRPLELTSSSTLLWQSLGDPPTSPHYSGRVAVVGHTPQPNGRVLRLPHLICLDTGCVKGGALSAMDVKSGTLWQAEEHDLPRRW